MERDARGRFAPRRAAVPDHVFDNVVDLTREVSKLRQDAQALRRSDGALYNSMTGLGVAGIDSRLGARIGNGTVLQKQDVDRLMRWEYGPKKYIEDLPKSALRKWIKLDVEGGRKDAAKKILDYLEEKRVRERLKEALTFERQYGGSAILLGLDDKAKLDTPVDLERVEGVSSLHVVSRWRLAEPGTEVLEDDPVSPRFGMPLYYRLWDTTGLQPLDQRIHHSRVIVFQGWSPHEREQRWEWGVSVLEPFWPRWRDYASALGTGLSLGARVNETRFKVKGLADLMARREWETIRKMVEEIHAIRSAFRVLFVDADDIIEDAAINFAGAAQLIQMAREDVAAASGLSLQAFFSLTREGLSDRDEGASERDDAAVAEYQRDRLLDPINRLVEIANAVIKAGARTWQVKFVPLREEAPGDSAARRSQEAATAKGYIDAKVVHADEVREGLRADPDQMYPLLPGSLEEAFPPPEPPPAPPGLQPLVPGQEGQQPAPPGQQPPTPPPPVPRADAFDLDRPRDSMGRFGQTNTTRTAKLSSDKKALELGDVVWERRGVDQRTHDVVEVDVMRLHANWMRTNPERYVGPGARPGNEESGKVQRAKEFFDGSRDEHAVHMPTVTFEDGGVRFVDGRHRVEAWRQMGHQTIPVAVPRSASREIRERFGAS